jgi:ribosomal protein S18 acetylase RimI-like enzyme
MYLDAELRNDTPGAEGWQPDLAWFVSETFESPYFDPETYPVAVTDGRLLGLARVWSGPVPNRLGHVGVRREHRRRGIALWLVGSIFEVLQRRGTASVTAEVDDGNVASLALFRHLGAVTTGGRIELARAALR